MKPDHTGKLWAEFLHGEIGPTDEATLFRQLEDDPALISTAMQDAEISSLLRELGRRHRDDDEQFVASVLDRLDMPRLTLQSTRYPVVPPPRGDGAPRNRPPIQWHDDQSATERAVIPMEDSQPAPAVVAAKDSNARIWWTLVAPLAAVTLIAITIAMIRDPDRVADQAGLGEMMVPGIPAERVAPPRPSAILAQTDTTAASEDGSPDRLDVHEQGSPEALAATIQNAPAAATAMIPPDQFEPVMEGFAELMDSSPDVLWYRRPGRTQPGQSLSLERGIVDFRLAGGTTVRIDGPAEFAVDSTNSLLLARGRVSADVPPRAVGFAIDTPTARIIDLGTRFDAHVTSSGATRLRVREGKVRVQPTTREASGKSKEWIVAKEQQKFVDSDGMVLDWKVDVTANVFGEIAISINGQPVAIEDADAIEALSGHSELQILRPSHGEDAAVGRYVFNGQTQDLEATKDGGIIDRLAQDFVRLADIARRAQEADGVYRVKDKQYPYTGLRHKLEARRTVARIYGPRVLGGKFWPREEFETTAGDCGSLEQLQRELISRLDFVDLGPNSLRQSTSRRVVELDLNTPAIADQQTDDRSDQEAVSFDRQRGDQRDEMLRRLEEMRRRKDAATGNGSKPSEAVLPEDQGTREPGSEPSRDDDGAPTDDEPPESSARSPQAGDDPQESMTSDPDEMVAQALEAEMRGEQEQRQALLQRALRSDPNHPAANWHSGRIALGRDWLDLPEVQQRAKSNPVLAAYQRMRADNDGSLDGNLKLARWCRTRRPQASRMYYARLLDNPQVTNPAIVQEAAKNLELVAYRGGYISKPDLERHQELERRYQKAVRRWDAALQKWAKWLRPQSRDEHQQRAEQEMREVDDPDIALIAGRYASYGSEAFGMRVVEILEQFATPPSTLCLARYGVDTMWPEVQSAATIVLRDRKMHDYVPQLLGMLIGKTESDGKVVRLPDGTIRLEHVYRQENATTNVEQRTMRNAEAKVSFEPTVLEAGPAPTGQLVRLPDRARWTGEGERIQQMFSTELARREASAESANAMAQLKNQRVYRLLADTTSQQLPDETTAWWNWWQDYNSIEYKKSNHFDFDYSQFNYTALMVGPRYLRQPPQYPGGGPSQFRRRTGSYRYRRAIPHRHSCFAAGTLIATETGLRPIEEIVAGDRVLAKHPETGQLKLQTVLVTTLRPPSPIFELKINDEIIRTTSGHPFWVTGEGWRMAKLLKAGDQLHGMHGVLHLEQIRPLVDPVPVHNLIVDEFHCYFAGSSMALVHDNTFRRPTPALLPGHNRAPH